MIKYGPADVVVLALREPQFDGSILTERERQAASGTIRVLDAMVLFKDEIGNQWRKALLPKMSLLLRKQNCLVCSSFTSKDLTGFPKPVCLAKSP
jgi:hypothetical protein